MRRSSAVAVALASALAFAVPASADTFCVNRAGCDPAHTKPTIPDALAASSSNGSSTDTIQVGAGTYSGPFNAPSGNPVNLVGAGDTTVLNDPTPASATESTLVLGDPGSSVGQLKIIVPLSDGGTGLVLLGTASAITVVDAPGAHNPTGVVGGKLDRSTIALTTSGSRGASGASSVTRSRISAVATGLQMSSAALAAADDVVRVSAADAVAINVTSNGFLIIPASVTGDQLTLIGPGPGTTSIGVLAVGGTGFDAGTNASAGLDGVVIRGFGTDLYADGVSTVCGVDFHPCMGSGSITVSYSDYSAARTYAGANGTITSGDGNLGDVDPGFANAATGDFSLRRDSPLIDVGDPAGPPGADPATDVVGAPRLADGDTNGVARMDIGAFELPANLPPTAAFSAPTQAGPGQTLAFDGGASSDPEGGPLTYAWSFGDGGTATGPQATHAFANPGSYVTSLVVTDDRHTTSSPATKTVVVVPNVVVRPKCRVPKLHGRTLPAARRALKRAHCSVGHITRRHARGVRRGRVISSRPKAGVTRANGAKIALVVSRGRPARHAKH